MENNAGNNAEIVAGTFERTPELFTGRQIGIEDSAGC